MLKSRLVNPQKVLLIAVCVFLFVASYEVRNAVNISVFKRKFNYISEIHKFTKADVDCGGEV